MPASPKAGSEISRASSALNLRPAIRVLSQPIDALPLSAVAVQEQQRGAFGGLEQGAVCGVEAAGQLFGETHTQAAQLRDARRHVRIAEHEQRAIQGARAVKGDVEVIGGQWQGDGGGGEPLWRGETPRVPEGSGEVEGPTRDAWVPGVSRQG